MARRVDAAYDEAMEEWDEPREDDGSQRNEDGRSQVRDDDGRKGTYGAGRDSMGGDGEARDDECSSADSMDPQQHRLVA